MREWVLKRVLWGMVRHRVDLSQWMVNPFYSWQWGTNRMFKQYLPWGPCTVYPMKYAHGFVVLCFVVVMQSFIMNWHEVFIHIHQGCFADTGAIVRLPQCQWSKPDGYGTISQWKPQQSTSKQKPYAYFLGYTVDNDFPSQTKFDGK